MARIRTIKPEFWTSEQVMDCSPLTRLLFIGMWNFCDDGGNHPASAKTLKAEVFPGDDIPVAEIQTMLAELSANGLLVFYQHQGKEYIHITGWQHQKIEKPTFKHPKYEPAMASMKSSANEAMSFGGHIDDEQPQNIYRPLDDFSPNDRMALDPGMEGKGKESKQEQKTSASCSTVAARRASNFEPLEGFAEFWLRYPKKKSKQEAEKAWAKLKPNSELRSTLMTALSFQVQTEDWRKQGGQFVPNAATWLNGRRWEDEVLVSPLGNHHGMNGERDYTIGLEANGDGTFCF